EPGDIEFEHRAAGLGQGESRRVLEHLVAQASEQSGDDHGRRDGSGERRITSGVSGAARAERSRAPLTEFETQARDGAGQRPLSKMPAVARQPPVEVKLVALDAVADGERQAETPRAHEGL